MRIIFLQVILILFIIGVYAQPPACCSIITGNFPLMDCDCSGLDITLTPTNICTRNITANSITIEDSGDVIRLQGCILNAVEFISVDIDNVMIANNAIMIANSISIVVSNNDVEINSSSLTADTDITVEINTGKIIVDDTSMISNSITMSTSNNDIEISSNTSFNVVEDISITIDNGKATIAETSFTAGRNITIAIVDNFGVGSALSIGSTSFIDYRFLQLEGTAGGGSGITAENIILNPAVSSSGYVYGESNSFTTDIVVFDSGEGSTTFSNFTFDVVGTNSPSSGIHFLGNNEFIGDTFFDIDISGASGQKFGIIFDPDFVYFNDATVDIVVYAPVGIIMSSQFTISESNFNIECISSPTCIKMEGSSNNILDSDITVTGTIQEGSFDSTGLKIESDFSVDIIRSIVDVNITVLSENIGDRGIILDGGVFDISDNSFIYLTCIFSTSLTGTAIEFTDSVFSTDSSSSIELYGDASSKGVELISVDYTHSGNDYGMSIYGFGDFGVSIETSDIINSYIYGNGIPVTNFVSEVYGVVILESTIINSTIYGEVGEANDFGGGVYISDISLFNSETTYLENVDITGIIERATEAIGVFIDVNFEIVGDCGIYGSVTDGINTAQGVYLENQNNDNPSINGNLEISGNATCLLTCEGVYFSGEYDLEGTGSIAIYGEATTGILVNSINWQSLNSVYFYGIGDSLGISFDGDIYFDNLQSLEVIGDSSISNADDSKGVNIINGEFITSSVFVNIEGYSEASHGIYLQSDVTFFNPGDQCEVIINGYSNTDVDIFLSSVVSKTIETQCSLKFDGYTHSDSNLNIEGSGKVQFTSDGIATRLTIDTENGCEFNNGFSTDLAFTVDSISSSFSFLCGNISASNAEINNQIIVDCIDTIDVLSISADNNIDLFSIDGSFGVVIEGEDISISNNIGINDALNYITISGRNSIYLENGYIETVNNQEYTINRNIGSLELGSNTDYQFISQSGEIQFDTQSIASINDDTTMTIIGNSWVSSSTTNSISNILLTNGEHTIEGEYTGTTTLDGGSEIIGNGIVQNLEIGGDNSILSPDLVSLLQPKILQIEEFFSSFDSELNIRITTVSNSRIIIEPQDNINGKIFLNINDEGSTLSKGSTYYPVYSMTENLESKDLFYMRKSDNTEVMVSNCSIITNNESFRAFFDSSIDFGNSAILLKVNSPPVIQMLNCETSCTRNSDCTCCVNYASSVLDPDASECSETFSIVDNQNGLFMNLQNSAQVCYTESSIQGTTQRIKTYQVEDSVGDVSNNAIINFNFNVPSLCPTPSISISATTSITTTKTSSSSLSVTKTQSNNPTTSSSSTLTPTSSTTTSITPKESLQLVRPSFTSPSTQISTSRNQISLSPSTSRIVNQIMPSSSVSVSSRSIPTAAVGGCTNSNCQSGSTQSNLGDASNNNQDDVALVSDDGNIVGAVIIPNTIAPDGTIAVSFISNIQVNTAEVTLGNSIFDITISDSFGSSVSKFDESLTICFEEEGSVNDDACLGFYNTETESWECTDDCLTKEGNQYCGTTNHLTSFALILEGNNNNNGCGETGIDLIITYISAGFVVFAIIVVIIGVALIEFKYKLMHIRRARTLRLVNSESEKYNLRNEIENPVW